MRAQERTTPLLTRAKFAQSDKLHDAVIKALVRKGICRFKLPAALVQYMAWPLMVLREV